MYYDFKFYPGACGVLEEAYEVEDFFVSGKYILDPSEINDYALLKLKKKVERKEYLPLGTVEEKINRNS